MVLGLIITDACDNDYPYLALELRMYSDVDEFRLTPIDNKMFVNYDIEKRRDNTKPLLYGDTIEWRQNSKRKRLCVGDFTVVNRQFEVRNDGCQLQLLFLGLVSPNRSIFWPLNGFPPIELREELRMEAEPNVAVKAWVVLRIVDEMWHYELCEFDSISIEDQPFVRSVPWNIYNSMNFDSVSSDCYVNHFVCPSDGADDFKASPYPPMTIQSEGVVLSERSIMCGKWSEAAIILPLAPKANSRVQIPPIGSRVKFVAEYLSVVGYYCIQQVSLNVGTTLKTMGTSPDGNLCTTVRFLDEHRGFYESKALMMVVDDPLGVMAPVGFSKFVNSAILVEIKEGRPTKHGRARRYIVGLGADKKDKINAVRNADEMKIEASGVVSNRFGAIYMVEHPYFHLKVPKEDISLFPPGSIVDVVAHYDQELQGMKLVEVKKSTYAAPIKYSVFYDDDIEKYRLLFCVNATGRSLLPRLMFNETFGFIEPPSNFIVPLYPEQQRYTDVWITASDKYPGDDLPAQCAFQFYYQGDITMLSTHAAEREAQMRDRIERAKALRDNPRLEPLPKETFERLMDVTTKKDPKMKQLEEQRDREHAMMREHIRLENVRRSAASTSSTSASRGSLVTTAVSASASSSTSSHRTLSDGRGDVSGFDDEDFPKNMLPPVDRYQLAEKELARPLPPMERQRLPPPPPGLVFAPPPTMAASSLPPPPPRPQRELLQAVELQNGHVIHERRREPPRAQPRPGMGKPGMDWVPLASIPEDEQPKDDATRAQNVRVPDVPHVETHEERMKRWELLGLSGMVEKVDKLLKKEHYTNDKEAYIRSIIEPHKRVCLSMHRCSCLDVVGEILKKDYSIWRVLIELDVISDVLARNRQERPVDLNRTI